MRLTRQQRRDLGDCRRSLIVLGLGRRYYYVAASRRHARNPSQSAGSAAPACVSVESRFWDAGHVRRRVGRPTARTSAAALSPPPPRATLPPRLWVSLVIGFQPPARLRSVSPLCPTAHVLLSPLISLPSSPSTAAPLVGRARLSIYLRATINRRRVHTECPMDGVANCPSMISYYTLHYTVTSRPEGAAALLMRSEKSRSKDQNGQSQ